MWPGLFSPARCRAKALDSMPVVQRAALWEAWAEVCAAAHHGEASNAVGRGAHTSHGIMDRELHDVWRVLGRRSMHNPAGNWAA